MSKILLFSHSGFSNQNANGITMKNLLSGWEAFDKAEFYCDVQPPDYSAAHQYFRVTDMDVIKSFLGKKTKHIFTASESRSDQNKEKNIQTASKSIPAAWKKRKYDFRLKWIRELMRMVGPWGHFKLQKWIEQVAPDILVYMVGESLAMDKLVLKTCRRTGIPLVLYNGEAYRIIDLQDRNGLERAYYRATKRLYRKLAQRASVEIYNCPMLQESYAAEYGIHGKPVVAYNSAECDYTPYQPDDHMNITYFGNLGVGRVGTLLETAEVLYEIDPTLCLDIYGQAKSEDEALLRAQTNIRYNGFVDAKTLKTVIDQSDILLHVESFDEDVSRKLKYAFSTKIAQCLCSGRCFISYAPLGTASTQYLLSVGAPVVCNRAELKKLLNEVVNDSMSRQKYANMAGCVGANNHDLFQTSRSVKNTIEVVLCEKNDT